MSIASYRDLVAWQKAMDLAEAVNAATEAFPKTEDYGLTAQIRRAAVSIPSNIAEGRSRRTTREFLKGLSIAYGSVAEVETQVLLASRLKYVSSNCVADILNRTAEIGRLLNGLIHSLRAKLDANA